MIKFIRNTLSNGLRVLIHRDDTTPMAVVNLLYDVGSRDEHPESTGFAHLFEHLMFGGSAGVPFFDREVQKAGGENNAFTTNDITNYYIHLPAVNIETGIWLESDRMKGPLFTRKGLAVQKNVVTEEFKQRYLNQPYGDIWLLIRELAYKVHPYRWPPIGREVSHIAKIDLNQVKQFFNSYYSPSNAILVIAGNVDEDDCIRLTSSWFGEIEHREPAIRNITAEPGQTEARQMKVFRDVPFHEIIIACRMCSRDSREYHASDLISDLLSGGKSSILYRNLVMEKKLFSSINAFITGDRDPGLFVVRGRVTGGAAIEYAHEQLLCELNDFASSPPDEEEVEKVKNKLEATRQYAHTDILHKAADLAYYELLVDAGELNNEISRYRKTTPSDILSTAKSIFDPKNSNTLLYCSKKQPSKP